MGPSDKSQYRRSKWKKVVCHLWECGPHVSMSLDNISAEATPLHSPIHLPLSISLYTLRTRMNTRTRERKDWRGDWRRKEGRRRKH